MGAREVTVVKGEDKEDFTHVHLHTRTPPSHTTQVPFSRRLNAEFILLVQYIYIIILGYPTENHIALSMSHRGG